MTLRLATDIGGTFTDLVAFDEETGALTIGKASTTPADLPQGVLDAVTAAGVSLGEVAELVHGTTVVINALTERRGARTALVTTEGFRDVLEIGRGNRPDMYNLVSRKPPPFVPRRHRFEVRGRVDRHGAVLRPLELDDLEPAVEACRRDGVEAVAVCLLHSYAHPEHEQAVREALVAALPGVPVTTSSDLTREWREYERSSTAVLNAYVQPTVERYLGALEDRLAAGGLRAPVRIVQSNGGTTSVGAARRTPIRLVESGPAAGVLGAARLGEELGEANVLYLDIGGTTAKCSLIENGEPKTTTEYRIEWRPDYAGYPIMVPVVDIVEIGAGGGSIAWLDDGGSVRVGPRSAAAEPGPACYGRGGESPTVTDAKLAASVLDPEYFLGGRLRLHPRLAEEALRRLGAPLGLAPTELANGIIRLVNANMISALKLVSVRRGYDPRDFVLVAAGGGGPMHAAALGAELQVKRVVIPPHSGVFSAWGMGLSEARVDAAQTRVLVTSGSSPEELDAVFARLEREVTDALVAEGAAGSLRCERSADMRYRGQEHAVRVPLRPGPVSVAAIEADFHALHRQKYTFDLEGDPVEIVTCHVSGFGGRALLPAPPTRSRTGRPTPKGRRRVDFDADGVHEAAVHDRDALPAGFRAPGPLVIEDETTTALVHPGQSLEVDAAGNLIVCLQ
ncbi:MAG TPA: hydantoinase/oxoprolinase family protein [Gaiellaceae bacterium]|nr:hydantoinase/oxoprolinase family protein [Gaiellaceae bacterium]